MPGGKNTKPLGKKIKAKKESVGNGSTTRVGFDESSMVSQLSAEGSQTTSGSRKGFKQSFVGSTDSSVPGLIESQGNALMDAIRDLERNERERQKWMDRARSNARREELETRYTLERERDKTKLDQLIQDFKATKSFAEQGHFDTISQVRSSQRPTAWNTLQTMDADRFVGLKTHSEQIFHRSRIETFEKTDKRAEARFNRKSFDIYDEKRKANLLREKRTILQQMVDIQKIEYNDRRRAHFGGGGGGGAGGASLSSLAYVPSPRSDAGSVRSGASWATFGSRASTAPPKRPTRPSNVPKLKGGVF